MEFTFGHVDPGTGITEFFTIFSVCKTGVIDVLVGNGAVIDLLIAAIADIGGFVQSVTAFLFKIGACLITGRAGSTFDATENDLAAGIGLSAVITVDTEVPGIVKSALMIPVRQTMCLHFFRDGSGIFAQVFGNVLESRSFIQRIFNVDTVFKGKMFLVAGNIFAHKISSYCCQKET